MLGAAERGQRLRLAADGLLKVRQFDSSKQINYGLNTIPRIHI